MADTAENVLGTSDEPVLDKGSVGLGGAIMAGLGQAAPLWSLVFTLPFIVGYVGISTPLAMLVAMLAVGATANSLAEFSAMYPSAGSFSTFIARGIGPRTSVVVSLCALLGYMIAFASIYVFVGIYIAGEFFSSVHWQFLPEVIALVYGALVIVPVVLKIRIGIEIVVIAFAVEALTLLILSFTVLFHGGAHGLSLTPFTTLHASKDFGFAFAFAILAFVGFEAPAPLAEETKNPRRNVPLALLLVVLGLGLLYMLVTYSAVVGVGLGQVNTLVTSTNPLATVGKMYLSWLVPALVWIALTSVTGSYVAANVKTARVIFNGAREGLWFSGLAKLHARYQSPWKAGVAFAAPSVLLGVVVALIVSPTFAAGFLGTYGSLGIIIMYLMVNVALVVRFARDTRSGLRPASARRVWLHVVTPCIAAVVMLLPVWSILQPGQTFPYNYLWLFTLLLIAVCTAYMLWLSSSRPDKLAAAGSLILGEVELEGQGPGEPPESRSQRPDSAGAALR